MAILARVEVDAHVERVGVDALDVAVEDAVEVIEIVVLRANGIVVGSRDSQPTSPSVVLAHTGGDIAVVGVNPRLHVASTNANVGRRIIAIGAIGRALFARDLHHANLTGTTRNAGSASAFLEGDGSQEDGGDAGFVSQRLENVEVRCAGFKDVSWLLEDSGQVLVDNVLERDWWRDPTVTVDTAVEPVLRAVWSGRGGGIRGGIWITAWASSGLNDWTSRVCWLAGRRGRRRLCDRLRGRFGRGRCLGRRRSVCRGCRVCWRGGKSDIFGNYSWTGSRSSWIGSNCLVDGDMRVRVMASSEGLSADTPCHPFVAWVDMLRRGRDGSRHQGKYSDDIRECKLHFDTNFRRLVRGGEAWKEKVD